MQVRGSFVPRSGWWCRPDSAIQGGLVGHRDGDALAAVQGLDGRVGDDGGRVPVPAAGAERPDTLDGGEPLGELDVVGADEPLPPVLGHPAGERATLADDDRGGLGQADGALLADDLAPDVVAVADVDI